MDNKEQLSFLSDDDRMKIYRELVSGTQHFWSKGKMQEDKIIPVVEKFVHVAKTDPIFMAQLTSWIMTKSDSKDLKVIVTFANSLSDADGTPFFVGSKLNKPNLRNVSQAALQDLDPKLAYRVAELGRMKISLNGGPKTAHMTRSMRTAIKKYIKFRETNPTAMKASGFAQTFKDLYRAANVKPSEAAYTALKWKQGNKERGVIKPVTTALFNFEGKSDIEVASIIQKSSVPALTALSSLDRKVSPVIAAALLEKASGNQALILRKLWDGQGLLKDKEVTQIFKEKLSTATSLDRVEKINTQIDKEVEAVLRSAKSDKQKEIAGDLGSVYLHLDISGSMEEAIDFAKECASVFAECVNDPKNNFHWGAYNNNKIDLKKPETFTKADFYQALYGVKSFGGTDCFIRYTDARSFDCDYDIHFTDQDCSTGLANRIREAGGKKPKGCVVVNFSKKGHTRVQKEYEANGIPVVVLSPQALKESANIAQTIKAAVKGSDVILAEILSVPLLKLPTWWYALSIK